MLIRPDKIVGVAANAMHQRGGAAHVKRIGFIQFNHSLLQIARVNAGGCANLPNIVKFRRQAAGAFMMVNHDNRLDAVRLKLFGQRRRFPLIINKHAALIPRKIHVIFIIPDQLDIQQFY